MTRLYICKATLNTIKLTGDKLHQRRKIGTDTEAFRRETKEEKMRNHAIVFWGLTLFSSLVLAGCTTAKSQPTVAVIAEKDLALPLIVEKAMCRSSRIGNEGHGQLTVNNGFVEFVFYGGKGTIKIPRENIQKVVWGQMSGDFVTDWTIVYYTEPGNNSVAAFSGTLYSPVTDAARKIYSAIFHITKVK